jgi:hypothetical protein
MRFLSPSVPMFVLVLCLSEYLEFSEKPKLTHGMNPMCIRPVINLDRDTLKNMMALGSGRLLPLISRVVTILATQYIRDLNLMDQLKPTKVNYLTQVRIHVPVGLLDCPAVWSCEYQRFGGSYCLHLHLSSTASPEPHASQVHTRVYQGIS